MKRLAQSCRILFENMCYYGKHSIHDVYPIISLQDAQMEGTGVLEEQVPREVIGFVISSYDRDI